MNTRLQVEHPVTELITGVDLVEQMIRVAAGETLSITQDDVKLTGWAVESRLYAEDPYRNFLPSIGRLTRYRPPQEGRSGDIVIRNDTGVTEGSEISMFYDPMIAKLCTWAPDRLSAIEAMSDALDSFVVDGIQHNMPFLAALMNHPRWRVRATSRPASLPRNIPTVSSRSSLPMTTRRCWRLLPRPWNSSGDTVSTVWPVVSPRTRAQPSPTGWRVSGMTILPFQSPAWFR